ncbi:MAG: LUD domain-containing protein [Candidatus Limimorpha sp.]
MTEKGAVFNKNVREIAFSAEHLQRMESRYVFFRKTAENHANQYSDIELEKSRAYNIRNKVFKNYDKLLVDFETNVTHNGGIVRWAKNADEVRQMIYDIINEEKVKNVIKSKSVVAEEVNLISFLEMKKVRVTETDTGDFICHLFNERPYDSVHSASNKLLEEIGDAYSEKFGVQRNLSPKKLMTVTNKVLKERYAKAEMAITGADFLVADTGDIVISEDEGNVLKSMAVADVHVVLVGIDKLIASSDDLNVLLPLSSVFKVTKVKSSALYTFINKPAENNGIRQRLYVILVDNGRSDVLEKEEQRKVFTCIGCGACHTVCPVFNTVGGHVYDNPTPGPIGNVITPIMQGYENAAHLATLCTSCHLCENYCPMNIKLSELILRNRVDIARTDKNLLGEKNLINFLLKRVENRKNLDKTKDFLNNLELKQLLKKSWCIHREIPKFEAKSFSQLWKETNNII